MRIFMRLIWCVIALSFSAIALYPQTEGAQTPPDDLQISGTLVDSRDGVPISGGRVTLAEVNTRNDLATVITGDDGSFIFRHLASGNYDISAQRRGYLRQSFDQHGAYSTSIIVGPGFDSSNLVFRLNAECSITGTIFDEAGEAVRDAEVSLYQPDAGVRNQNGGSIAQVITNGEGFYRFNHLHPGQYMVSVSAKVWYAQRPRTKEDTVMIGESSGLRSGSSNGLSLGAGDYDDEQGPSPLDVAYSPTLYPGVTESRSRPTITLRSGDKFVADIGLQPVPALHIRVDSENPATARTREVRLQRHMLDGSESPVFAETRVSKSGAIDIVGVPLGRYSVKISGGDGNDVLSVIDATASGPTAVHDALSAQVSAIVQAPPGSLVGSKKYLQVYNFNTREYLVEEVPEDGEVRFKQRASPGEYEISLSDRDRDRGLFVRSVTAVGAVVIGRAVQIQGKTPVRLKVTFGRGASQVTGRALRKDQPVAGAMIVLVPMPPDHNRGLFRRDQTNSDGSFSIASVVPGKYTLVAIENGWDLEWWSARVLKPYLELGKTLDIEPNEKYRVEVKVNAR